jgi:pimeloyl-ACP methyl ester carboxylesterase
VAHLNPDTTVVRLDVSGTGGSPDSPLPYGFPYLAAVLGRLLKKLGIRDTVDILGLSWGGALAQQFAFQNPHRCRRLILVSTATGRFMVAGKPAVLAKMLTSRRFLDDEYAASIAGDLFGGTARTDPLIVIPEGVGPCQHVSDQRFCLLWASVYTASGEDRGQDGAPAA